MTEERFDEAVRGLLENAGETVPPEIWAGVEGALVRKSRVRVIRRAFGYAAAAAACLVGGLLLFDKSGETVPQDAVAVVEKAAEVIGEPEDIAPIAQQIERIERHFAQAAEAPEAPAVEEPMVETSVEKTTETTSQEPANQKQPANDKQSFVTEEKVDDWWNRPDPADKQHRHVLLAVNSNITSISSEGGSFSNFGPAHVSSQTGSTARQELPIPVDEPSYYLPLSFGVQLKLPLNKSFSFGIGADYTYIVTRYASLVNSVYYADTYTQLHYVGVPVNLYWDFLKSDKFGAYASVGAMSEKCVSSRYVFGSNVLRKSVDGFQHSMMAGIGVEYWLVDNIGLYLDPSLVYYFGNENHPQPLSIRTAEPLQVRFEAGLRFKF